MNTFIIFSLLVVLMLTGMPISISLGLTVLSFLFFLTHVPIESVALKLFTGIEKFEIMAIPFFILAGNFLTHGGVGGGGGGGGRGGSPAPPPRWSATGMAGSAWGACSPARCSPQCPDPVRRR
jgi:hypothetical protein